MPNTKKLYFDESGYTGSNVVDAGQPIFVYGSVCLTDNEVATIKSIVPASIGECHFKALRKMKDGVGDAVILSILNHPLINPDTVKVLVANKKANISAQVIQYIVEDVHADKGDYLIWGGRDRKMASDLYMFLDAYPNNTTVDLFYNGFKKLFTEKGSGFQQGKSEFYQAVDEMQANCNDVSVSEIFSDLQTAKADLEEILSGYDKFALDYTATALHRLAYEWKKKNGVRLDGIVDDSKPIKDKLATFQQMINATTQLTFNTGAVTMHANLELASIKEEDSQKCFGLQVADMVASAFARIMRTDIAKTDFDEALLKSNLKYVTYYPMLND